MIVFCNLLSSGFSASVNDAPAFPYIEEIGLTKILVLYYVL